MTSPLPLSSYSPTCSYCWKEIKKNPIFFIRKHPMGEEFHWVCSKECEKGFMKDERYKCYKDKNAILNKLSKMYIEIYNDKFKKKNFFKRIFNKK